MQRRRKNGERQGSRANQFEFLPKGRPAAQDTRGEWCGISRLTSRRVGVAMSYMEMDIAPRLNSIGHRL
jgi:hypothetical protein